MGDFSELNNRVTGFVTTPYLTYYAEDRPWPDISDYLSGYNRAGSFQCLQQRGMQWGLVLHNSQGICRSTDA